MCLSASSFLSLCGFRNLSARFLGEKRTPTNPILHRRLITWLEYSESRGNDSSRSSRVINNLSNITIRFFLLLFPFFLFLTREDFSSKVRKFYNTDSKVTRCALTRAIKHFLSRFLKFLFVFALANFFSNDSIWRKFRRICFLTLTKYR